MKGIRLKINPSASFGTLKKMPGKLEASLFRLLRQHARGLPKGTSEVIPIFDRRAWLGKGGSPTLTFADDIPSLGPPFTGVRHLSAPQLIGEVRRRFREAGGSVDQALEAIKALDEQRYLRERQKCHTTQETGSGLSIRICSITEPVGADEMLEYYDDDDDEDEKQYWTYRIRITNCSGALMKSSNDHRPGYAHPTTRPATYPLLAHLR